MNGYFTVWPKRRRSDQDRPFELAFFIITLTGALTASERVHRVLPVAMLTLFVAMVVLTGLRPG